MPRWSRFALALGAGFACVACASPEPKSPEVGLTQPV